MCIAGSSLQSKLYDEYFFFLFSSHLMMTCFFLIRIDISFLR
ncbi:putative membrane protein [Escherichia coli BCE034_MS-14]|nr:putative membrane protein [Escherichia coli BCE034_MS-14]